jgi:osmoprotectant transport system substrate-binding protein
MAAAQSMRRKSVISFGQTRLLKFLAMVPLMAVLILAGCGGGGSGTTGANNVGHGMKLTVGGKLDVEAQLLTKMYTLLLRNAGYDVTEKAKLGTNQIVFEAINSGQIDLYPEFTATGLAKLGQSTTHNPQQDFQNVKQGYEQQYKITWLDAAPMNDTYGVCTSKANADSLHVTKDSDLTAIASQKVIATPPDGKNDPNVLQAMETQYALQWKEVKVLSELAPTFLAVKQGDADFNICYTTSGLIVSNNFVLLQDDKNVFPIYNPAPIIRQDTLDKSPAIKDVLNPLAPKLTTEAITKMNADVAGGKSVTEVATTFLKDQGLLPK